MRLILPSAVRLKCALVALSGLCALLPISSSAIGNITLAWDPSPDAGVVSYRVYYGLASGIYTSSVLAGSATTVTVSNLVEGVTYFFAATASKTNGLESDFSNEVSGTINARNQAPTLNALVNITLNEDAGLQTINLSGISSGATNETQTLTVIAASSNPSLIPNPAVSYVSPNPTGSLTFTPVTAAFGSATITVTVNDGGLSNNIVSRSFTVTVNPVNDSPTLNTLANVAINENAGTQAVNLSGISSGANNEIQTLTVTATSSNPALIPNPTVTYTSPNTTGSLTFTPASSGSGSATITVTVNDGGASNNVVSRLFTVTVNQGNQAPSISAITNRVIAMDTVTAPIPFTIGDPETPASNLTLSVNSDNQALAPNANITFGGTNNNRTVTATPAWGQTGVAHITITVSDGTSTGISAFQLTVMRRPAAPANARVVSQ
jgi:hypothetical protein